MWMINELATKGSLQASSSQDAAVVIHPAVQRLPMQAGVSSIGCRRQQAPLCQLPCRGSLYAAPKLLCWALSWLTVTTVGSMPAHACLLQQASSACPWLAAGWACLGLWWLLVAAQDDGVPCCLLWVTSELCAAVSKRPSNMMDSGAAQSMGLLTFDSSCVRAASCGSASLPVGCFEEGCCPEAALSSTPGRLLMSMLLPCRMPSTGAGSWRRPPMSSAAPACAPFCRLRGRLQRLCAGCTACAWCTAT